VAEKIGLEAVMDLSNWQAGVARYQRDCAALERASFSLGRALETGLGVAIGNMLPQAFARAKNYMLDFIRLAGQEETGIARLAAVVKATGAEWETASDAIEKYIAAQTRRAALDDGEGRQALARLIPIVGDYRKALALLPIAMDLAAAKGMDLATAALVVGRAATGSTEMLRRYGIVLSQNATATEAIAELQRRFAGTAEAVANTYEGSARRLSIATNDLRESVGSMLLPVLTRWQGALADLATSLLPAVKAAVGAIGPALTRAADLVWEALSEIPRALGITLAGAEDTAESGGRAIGEAIARGIESALPYVVGAIKAISRLIALWFRPHSPPRVAAEIDKWGAELLKYYFQAFQDADLSDIESLTARVTSLLKTALGYGIVSKEQARQMLAPLGEQLRALAQEQKQTGTVSEATFRRISAAAGPIGPQVENIARAFARAREQAKGLGDTFAEVARRWANEVARLYMQAFPTADISSVVSFAQRVGHTLQQAVEIGMIDEEQARRMLAPLQQAFARLFAAPGGKIQPELWQELERAAGPLAAQVRQLAEGFLAVKEELPSRDLGDAASRAGKLANEAERLRNAELRWRLATASTAEQVEILRAELAKLQPGTEEWYEMATQLAAAEKRLAEETERASKAAARGAADLSDMIEELEAGFAAVQPAWDALFQIDENKIRARSEEIANKIVGALSPTMVTAGGGLAAVLGESFRLALANALFPERRQLEFEPGPGGTFFGVRVIPADATWGEIADRLQEKIGGAFTTALQKVGLDPRLAALAGESWQYILVGGLLLRSPFISSLMANLAARAIAAALKGAVMLVPALIGGLGKTLADALLGEVALAALGIQAGALPIMAATLGGTAASLLVVLFPERAREVQDQMYLFLHNNVAVPLETWFRDKFVPFFQLTVPQFFTQSIPQAAVGVWAWVTGWTGEAWRRMSDWWRNSFVPFFTSTLPSAITGAVGSAVTAITTWASSWAAQAGALISSWYTGTWQPFWSEQVPGWVKDKKDALVEAVGMFLQGILEKADAMFQDIYDALTKPFREAWAWIQNLLSRWPTAPAPEEGLSRGGGGGGAAGALQAGTQHWRGGWALVGERGPELVRLPAGAQVWPAAATQRILRGLEALTSPQPLPSPVRVVMPSAAPAIAAAAAAPTVNVNIGPLQVASDIDIARLANFVRREVRQAMAGY